MLTNTKEREPGFGHADELEFISASPNARGTCDAYPWPWSREGVKGIEGITRMPAELSKAKLFFG